MNLHLAVLIISMIVWAISPFKQYKTEYFKLFFIYAIIDPVAFVSILLKLSITKYLLSLFMVISIFILFKITLKKLLGLLFSLFVSFIVLQYMDYTKILLFDSVLHLILIMILMSRFVRYLNEKKSVNIFLILLITYELMNLLKYTLLSKLLAEGMLFAVLTSMVQLFFGIAFWFINIKTKDIELVTDKSK